MALSLSMIGKKALKPKLKSLKVKVQRIKADMGKIREDQKCIRVEQRTIGERFGELKRQCDQLKEETDLVMMQSASNQIRLDLMFDILRARKDGDFDKAAILAHFLKLVSDRTRL
ncbi:hypothetical protein REPUB_Repub03eG0215600 [Reevesia pubescens]